MNRLVLIGNGFDLAHNLPTSYQEFIDWYWNGRFEFLKNCFSSVSKAPLCDVAVSGFLAWYSFFQDGPSVLYEKSGTELFLELCQRGICRPSRDTQGLAPVSCFMSIYHIFKQIIPEIWRSRGNDVPLQSKL